MRNSLALPFSLMMFSLQGVQSLYANHPAPTLAARQNNGAAVVDGSTLSTGINTVSGNVYTYTDNFLIGPSVTDGPGFQINPGVTQAYGCQIVDGMQQGDCNNIQASIDAALASITGNEQSGPMNTAESSPSSSDSSGQTSTEDVTGSGPTASVSSSSSSSLDQPNAVAVLISPSSFTLIIASICTFGAFLVVI